VELTVLDRELARPAHHRGQLGGVLDQVRLGHQPEPRADDEEQPADDREHDHDLQHGHPPGMAGRCARCQRGLHGELSRSGPSCQSFKSHDLMSSSVPSLPSSPIDSTPRPLAPGGRLVPQNILSGRPHESSGLFEFMYSLRSVSWSGHTLSGCDADHCGNASLAYCLSFIWVVLTLDSLNDLKTLGPTRRPMTIARIASTIMISSSVMPRWARAWARARARARARENRDRRLRSVCMTISLDSLNG